MQGNAARLQPLRHGSGAVQRPDKTIRKFVNILNRKIAILTQDQKGLNILCPFEGADHHARF